MNNENKNLIKHVIAIDMGKDYTKCADNKGTEFSFKSRFLQTDKDFPVQQRNYKITYSEGVESYNFVIGDSVQDTKRDNSTSKTSLYHKLALYTALTKCIEPEEHVELTVIIGCPLDTFLNRNLREKYRDYMKGSGKIKIIVNEKNYEFTIQRLLIKNEGSGIIYMKPAFFKEKKVSVVDIGGKNFNTAVYNNFVLQEESFTDDLGMQHLRKNMSKELKVTCNNGSKIDTDLIENALENDVLELTGKKVAKSIDIIDNVKTSYLREVVEINLDESVDLSNFEKVVWIGGGSQNIEKQINVHRSLKENSVIISEGQFMNVRGFLKFADTKINS